MFRLLVEFVREPDVQLGYLAFGWVTTPGTEEVEQRREQLPTMGQILSLPMILLGAWLLW